MLRRVWAEKAPENIGISWVGRRAAPGVNIVWNISDSVDFLPQCNAVLALWGPVSGDAETLGGNIPLAATAQRIARACGADRVFHASTAAVYAPSDLPLDEAAVCEPRNDYGRAKLRMEQALGGETPKPVRLRIGNVAGAGGLFTSLEGGGDITLDRFADGSGPVRSYVAPSMLARIVECLCKAPTETLPEILNVAGKLPVSMEDIVRAAGRNLYWRDAPDGALPVMALDVTRLDRLANLGQDSTTAEQLVEEWRRYRMQT